MALGEFDIIHRYFEKKAISRDDVILGIGDDAALLRYSEEKDLVVAVDTMVEGTHFFKNMPPRDVGYKVLAMNLSDLAAMGAEPAWATLALTLPESNEPWISEFSEGFFSLLEKYNMQLVGGDTTRGALSVTVQVMGFVPRGRALTRKGAKVGDYIYVTGPLGDAGLALQILRTGTHIPKSQEEYVFQRLYHPLPRIEEGIALRDVAHSAIDISDGLAADLQHILKESSVGATVIVEDLPLSEALCDNLSLPMAHKLALSQGDDYELVFTSPQAVSTYCCIGRVEEKIGLRLQHRDGSPFHLSTAGYQHF